MKYECYDKELIDFVENPLKHSSACDAYKANNCLRSRILLMFGLGKLISKADLICLLMKSFSSTLDKARIEAAAIRSSCCSEGYMNETNPKIKGMLANFDSKSMDRIISYRFDNPPEGLGHKELEQCQRVFQQAAHTRTMWRLYEEISFEIDDHVVLQYAPNLWKTFYICEVIYQILIGEFLPVVKRRSVHIVPCESKEIMLKTYWINDLFESWSDKSFQMHLQQFSYLGLSEHFSFRKADLAIEKALGRIFSLRTHGLSRKIKTSNELLTIKEIILFGLCAEYHSLADKGMSFKALKRATDIRQSTLDILRDDLSIANKEELDKSRRILLGFAFHVNGNFYRGDLNFTLGIKKLVSHFLGKVNHDLKDPQGEIGLDFEETYIFRELGKFESERYKVIKGFKPSKAAKIKGYDIDCVLVDELLGINYFIQIKYWIANTPIDLDERIKFVSGYDGDGSKNRFVHGVDRQLVSLRENIDKIEIKDRLRSIGLCDVTLENSCFVLLHNIPFLNFMERSGVVLYESSGPQSLDSPRMT